MNPPAFVSARNKPPTIDLGDADLRPLRISDAEAMAAYITDPRVVEHTSMPLLDLATVRANIERDIGNYANGTACRWALAGAEDRLFGICGFNAWSFAHEHAELAYDMSPDYWGHGLMRHAVRAVLHWAFDAGFRRVYAYAMTSNTRSIALLEACDFIREGTLREFRIARGVPRDFHLYALLKKDER